MVVILDNQPQLAESICSRSVTINKHKYNIELKKLCQRLEFLEKERKKEEMEKSEQEAAVNEKPGTSGQKPSGEKPETSDNEKPGTSKKPKMQ